MTRPRADNAARRAPPASRRGQSLIEIVVALALATITVGSAGAIVAAFLRSDAQTKRIQTATNLAREFSDNLRSFADASWYNVYNRAHGSGNHYYLNATSSTFSAVAGDETVTVDGVPYTRYFYVENAKRDLCGAGAITTNATTTCATGPGGTGVAEDPSTQRVTVVVTWPGTTSGVTLVEYLTRWPNRAFDQTSWSGGGGQEGPAAMLDNRFASSTNIDFAGTEGSLQLSGPPPYPSSGDLYSSVFDAGN